jgi:predicted phosphoadenosine phosphosulfate sulfurtransferase
MSVRRLLQEVDSKEIAEWYAFDQRWPLPDPWGQTARLCRVIMASSGNYKKNDIPDEAPRSLENAHWAPSWRRVCKVLLRNDWWCKGLGLTQPMSDAYERYMQIRKERKGRRSIKSANGFDSVEGRDRYIATSRFRSKGQRKIILPNT